MEVGKLEVEMWVCRTQMAGVSRVYTKPQAESLTLSYSIRSVHYNYSGQNTSIDVDLPVLERKAYQLRVAEPRNGRGHSVIGRLSTTATSEPRNFVQRCLVVNYAPGMTLAVVLCLSNLIR